MPPFQNPSYLSSLLIVWEVLTRAHLWNNDNAHRQRRRLAGPRLTVVLRCRTGLWWQADGHSLIRLKVMKFLRRRCNVSRSLCKCALFGGTFPDINVPSPTLVIIPSQWGRLSWWPRLNRKFHRWRGSQLDWGQQKWYGSGGGGRYARSHWFNLREL